MTEDRTEFLKKVPAFEGVGEDGLARFSGLLRSVEMTGGDVIIKEGEEGDTVFIIEEGQVEISMGITLALNSAVGEVPEAMEKVLVRLGPGAMFGEMAFIFEKELRSATITALCDGKLLAVSSEDFNIFMEKDAKSANRIILNIARIIAKRLRKTNEDMKKLTTVLSIALRNPVR